MKLEHVIKKVYEPIHSGGWEVNFAPPQWFLDWLEERENGEHKAFIETVEYI
jgi:hypothetical protein